MDKEAPMKVGTRPRLSVLASVIVIAGVSATAGAPERPPIADRFAEVNGIRLHYLVAGKGAPDQVIPKLVSFLTQ